MVTQFQGDVIDALNSCVDQRNMQLLDAVIGAANEVASNSTVTDATCDGDVNTHEQGSIQWGGKEASLQGTGGVALLEFAKDAIQTAASNISGVGTLEIQNKKVVERKIGAMG